MPTPGVTVVMTGPLVPFVVYFLIPIAVVALGSLILWWLTGVAWWRKDDD